MDQPSTPLDLTLTRLNTLHFLVDQQLLTLKVAIELAAISNVSDRARIEASFRTLQHLVDMADEIAEAHEPTLRAVARTVQALKDQDRITQACLDEIFDNYPECLGERAADQLFADAMAG